MNRLVYTTATCQVLNGLSRNYTGNMRRCVRTGYTLFHCNTIQTPSLCRLYNESSINVKYKFSCISMTCEDYTTQTQRTDRTYCMHTGSDLLSAVHIPYRKDSLMGLTLPIQWTAYTNCDSTTRGILCYNFNSQLQESDLEIASERCFKRKCVPIT